MLVLCQWFTSSGFMHKRLLIFSALVSVAFAAQPALADDFSDTIAYAYAHHPDIRAGEENLSAVRDTIWEAYGGFQPTISANYERGRKRFQFVDSDQKYVSTTTKQLNVTQPIFRGGATIAQLQGARAQTRAEEARFFQIGQEVLFNAIKAYANVYEAAETLEINRENVSRLEQHMDATQTRRKARDLTITDVAFSKARLSRAQAELSNAEGNYDSARSTFLREIGREPDVSALPPLPANLPASEAEVVALSKDNPNMVIAEETKKAADSFIDTRVSTILPNVSLVGKMEDQDGISTMSSSLNSLREDSVVLRVSIPIYQGGGEYARISQARHRYQKARHDTFDTVRDTRRNAVNAWNDYVSAKNAVASSKDAFEAARDAFGGIQEEYKYGSRTVMDVLDTQQELFAAQQTLLRAKSREVVGAYGLLAAIGRLDPKTIKLNLKKYENDSEADYLAASSKTLSPRPDTTNAVSGTDELAAADVSTEAVAATEEGKPYRIDLTLPPEAFKQYDMRTISPAAGKGKSAKKAVVKEEAELSVPAPAEMAAPVENVKVSEQGASAEPEPEEKQPLSQMDMLARPSVSKRH